MTFTQLNDLNATMSVDQQQQDQQQPCGQHTSSPPPPEAKGATSPPSSAAQPFRPSMTPYKHRSSADEVLVGPNDDTLSRPPPPSFRHGDAEESVHSVAGTCVEIELAEGLTEGGPVFRSPNFNGGEGHGDVVENRTRRQSMKRRASRGMSHTFESVVGFGRDVKRRVSSLWSRDDKERKDSRWVSLGGTEREQAVSKPQHAAETIRERRWTSKRASNASGCKQHNPYPAVTSLVARRATQNESRATSPHWTPYTSDARSTVGIEEGGLSRQATVRSVTSVVAPDADLRMDSLTRAARSEDFRFLTAEEIDADRPVPPPDGSRTPLDERPAGSSMMHTGYTLDRHLSQAMELGRFDMDRIEKRFNAGESEPATQESSFDDVAFFAQTPSAIDDDHESLPETITAESYHSAREILESSESRRRSSWWSWLRGRPSHPREPRPSVAHIDAEREPASSFGTTIAQVAGVVGTSMQQGSPVML